MGTPSAFPASRAMPAERPLLAVKETDGALLRTDVMFECIAALLKRPWALAAALWELRHGRAAFKAALARRAKVDVALLPFDESLLAWLRDEHAGGRKLVLYSAADESIVRAVAARFAVFGDVAGSDGRTNLRSERKYDAIEARYGSSFTYAGDSGRDVPIWARCRSAVLVGDVDKLRRALPNDVEITATFPQASPDPRTWVAALRAINGPRTRSSSSRSCCPEWCRPRTSSRRCLPSRRSVSSRRRRTWSTISSISPRTGRIRRSDSARSRRARCPFAQGSSPCRC